jgi:hypothetical protein
MEMIETPFFLWSVIGVIVMFGAGLLIGLRLGRTRQDDATRREAEELKAALRQSQEESRQYQAHVTHHFTQTADLLQTLTADYRAVYEHLAAGAQTLCNGQVKALNPEALREHLLPAPSDEGTRVEAPAPQPASSLSEGQPPLTEENHELQPGLAPAPGHSEIEDTRAREALPTYSHENVRQEP